MALPRSGTYLIPGSAYPATTVRPCGQRGSAEPPQRPASGAVADSGRHHPAHGHGRVCAGGNHPLSGVWAPQIRRMGTPDPGSPWSDRPAGAVSVAIVPSLAVGPGVAPAPGAWISEMGGGLITAAVAATLLDRRGPRIALAFAAHPGHADRALHVGTRAGHRPSFLRARFIAELPRPASPQPVGHRTVQHPLHPARQGQQPRGGQVGHVQVAAEPVGAGGEVAPARLEPCPAEERCRARPSHHQRCACTPSRTG